MNSYGMFRQENELLDDWQAFYSIQLQKYLRAKPSGRLENDAEKDMIYDLISDVWENLKQSGNLDNMTCEEKKELFWEENIVFPVYMKPPNHHDSYIRVDFTRKTVVCGSDRCFCGSGLSYDMCCGRTPGMDEINFGIF